MRTTAPGCRSYRAYFTQLLLWFAAAIVTPTPFAYANDGLAFHEGVHRGAEYILYMPEAWNGGLVMFAHGYEGEGPGLGTPRGSPMHDHLRNKGYAWAASGYRSKGYRPDWFLLDTLALREHFIERFGKPRWTIIHGQSMGGHVAISSLELHPEVYQGGLIECGVIDGVGLVDWLYAYTAVGEHLSKLPLLDADRSAFGTLANAKWPELMGMPGNYTEQGRVFDNVVKHLSGGDLPLRLEGMKRRYIQNLNARDPGVLNAQEFARHADTRGIHYDIDPGFGLDAAALNRDVRRVTPQAGARSVEVNPVFAELSGRIQVPVITIHETADFRVPFRLQQDYFRRAQRADTKRFLVQRAVRGHGHCAFEGVVRERAFDELVLWIEQGKAPEGDDVLGDVSKLGLRWTPSLDPNDPAARR